MKFQGLKNWLVYGVIGFVILVIILIVSHDYWYSKWENEFRSAPITLKIGKAHPTYIKMKSDTIPLTQNQIDNYIESRYRIRSFDIDYAALIVGVVGLFMVIISLLLYRELQRVEEAKTKIEELMDKTRDRLEGFLIKFDNEISTEKTKLSAEILTLKAPLEKDIAGITKKIDDLELAASNHWDKFMTQVRNYEIDNKTINDLVRLHDDLFEFLVERENYIDDGQLTLLHPLLNNNSISRITYDYINDQIDISGLFSPDKTKRVQSATNLRGRTSDQRVIDIMKKILSTKNLSDDPDYRDALIGAIEDISKRKGI